MTSGRRSSSSPAPSFGEEAETAHIDAEYRHFVGDHAASGAQERAVAAEADEQIGAGDALGDGGVIELGDLPDFGALPFSAPSSCVARRAAEDQRG